MNVKEIIDRSKGYRIHLVAQGIIIGALVSFVIVLFRISLSYANTTLLKILTFCKGSIGFIALWFLTLAFLAYLVSKLIKAEPLISGSGIPQLEAELTGHLNSKWYKVLSYKFLGGLISLFAGLSIGREGPSIQLGSMVAKGFGQSLKRSKTEQKFLITCGASAGLAAAFHAPLAGVMFAIEEVHKHFSISLIIAVMCSSLTSDYVLASLLGMKPVFSFVITEPMPEEYYPILIILGIVLGLFGVIYNNSLLKCQDILQSKYFTDYTRLLFPFLLAGVIGFIYPALLAGGENLIKSLTLNKFSIYGLLIILIAKFLFSIISYSSTAPGGIFFPLLVLGSITGAIFGQIAVDLFNVSPYLFNNFVIVAMAGLFASIVRAPLTGIILLFEMTGAPTSLLSISVVAITSFIVAELLGSKPIYESLFDKLISKDDVIINVDREKVLAEFAVSNNSYIENRQLKDVRLPKGCLIVTIYRNGFELIPNGNTTILAGDIITTVNNCDIEAETYATMVTYCQESPYSKK